MANILVTGAGGYIGSHAVKGLLKSGHCVIAFDNFSRGYREPLEILSKYGELKVVEGDTRNIEDLNGVFRGEKIDFVMHFAALCNVSESVGNKKLYFENNVTGTANLVQAMKGRGVGKIIFSSTCAVYGETEYLPVNETHPLSPVNPYGESKLQAEKLIEDSNLKYIILRYFNVCGTDPTGEIGDNKKPQVSMVQNAVRGALGLEPFFITSPEVATPDGTPIRDYIDVMDVVYAHVLALEYLKKGGKNQIINLGSGKGFSVMQIIKEVQAETGKEFEIKKSANPREGESKEIYASTEKAKNVLGWMPTRALRESIHALINWYGKNPNGYKK